MINASQPKYKVTDIPKSLLQDAKAVIRNREVVFDIGGYGKATMKVFYAITILNKNGIDLSVFQAGYNKFSSINKIKAVLYDQFGGIIKTDLNTSVRDFASFTNYSLYDDYRVKIFDPKYATTPFTIEYSFEVNFNGLLNYPEWKLYDDYNISTEKTEYTIVAPKGFKFRYFERNLAEHCFIDSSGIKTVYKWRASGLPAIRKELYSPPLEEYTSIVLVAPDEFEIGGYKGNCETWSDFGLWIKDLCNNKNILNENTRRKIMSLVEGVTDVKEKIRILYSFMQNKVRYVSVQKGIGGWQPIDAESVDRLSYGDCKALSNYMKSLLDIIGVKSYYTLVNAGASAPSVLSQFPSNQFNHVIICVPVRSDTIWLECTDQKIPFGYLGTFTDDRKVLLIDETGGKIVNSPAFMIDNNTQTRKALIEVNIDGSANASIKTTYSGAKYDDVFKVLMMDKKDQENYIHEKIDFPGYDLSHFNYSETREMIPSISEDLLLNIHDFGSLTGNQIIINPNLFSRFKIVPVCSVSRVSPLYIRRYSSETDTLIFHFKKRFKNDIRPENFSLFTSFGEYKTEYSLKDNKLTYIRSFKLFKGNYTKELYDKFIEFLDGVRQADEKQIILREE